ncbi:MAG: hypothetical protein ACK55E_09985 [Cyanobacteriota bacterium]
MLPAKARYLSNHLDGLRLRCQGVLSSIANHSKRWPALQAVSLPPRLLAPFLQRINHVLMHNGVLQLPEVKGRIAQSL